MGAGGSLVCHRSEERTRWLQDVGRHYFDIEDGTDVDVLPAL